MKHSLRHAIAVMLALLMSPAIAGSCKIQSVNGQSVQVCDNDHIETRSRYGQTRSSGVRNSGVPRYPGSVVPAWAIQNRQ